MTSYASDGSVLAAPTDTTTPADAPAEPVLDVETVDETPAPAPEPADPTAIDGEVVDADTATDVAVIDDEAEVVPWAHEGDWKYDELKYHGDMLAIRVPHLNALNALYQAQATCSEEFVLQLIEKFVKRHLSQKSIERVLERMSDPDDEPFYTGTAGWNDLLAKISNIGSERALKDAKELAAVKSGKGK